MKSIIKEKKKSAITKGKLGKYILYAIGEILLIIIGILIAVQINDHVLQTQNSQFRCIYLNELLYTFEYDIKDVEDNLKGFENWNPKIHEILSAIKNNRLPEVDSLHSKLGMVGNYIVFGQRSKTKIEELKYSNINIIENRKLKNKILLYQNENIATIRNLEQNYNLIGEDLRQYYAKHFSDFNYTNAIPVNLEELKNDNYYYSIVLQRLRMNRTLETQYEKLNIEQKEIRELIVRELELKCID